MCEYMKTCIDFRVWARDEEERGDIPDVARGFENVSLTELKYYVRTRYVDMYV